MVRRIPNSLTTLAVVAFLFFFFTQDALAATYYIDAVSGSNSNNGTDSSTAWQTTANVNTTTFQPGDQILFKRGQTHIGNVSLTNESGTSGNPIIVDAYGTGANPIIDAAGLSVRTFDIRNNASYITIQNLTIRGGTSAQVFVFTGVFVGLQFKNLDIASTTGFSINANASTQNTLLSNVVIHDVTGPGFQNTGTSTNDTIQNYTFTGTGLAISFNNSSAATSTITVQGATITGGAGSGGIELRKFRDSSFTDILINGGGISDNVGLQNTTFSSTTVTGASGHGISISAYSSGLTITNATTTGNGLDGVNIAGTNGTTTITGLYSANNTNDGFDWTGSSASSQIVISNSTFQDNGNALNLYNGVALHGAGYATTTNSIVQRNSNDGYNIKGTVNAVFGSTTSYYNGTAGQENAGAGDGYSWHDTSTGTLYNSTAKDNLKGGVTNINSSSIVAYGNVFIQSSSTPSSGMTSFDNSAVGVLYNNTYYNPTQQGSSTIYKSTATGSFYNNIIYGFAVGIDKTTSGTFASDYNILYSQGTSAVSGSGFSMGAHSLTTNPNFADAANSNFQLSAPSPAINAGSGSFCSTTDRAGNTRQGVCDIGAYEYIDTTAPVISLSGAPTITQDTGQSFSDPGATATDNVDGTVSVTTTGSVNTASAGTYTLTYSASDAAGNAATPVSRTVVIRSGGNGSPLLLGSSGGVSAPSTPLPQIGTTTATSTVGSKSGLTSTQISAILSLLTSFEVSSSTIQTVSAILRGAGATNSSGFIFKNFLNLGSTGVEVLELQKRLSALGYFTAEPTGYFGQVTLAAVKAFQGAHGLDQFGYVGPGTRAALNGQ